MAVFPVVLRPPAGRQELASDLATRPDGLNPRDQHAVHVFRLDLGPRLVAKKVVASRQATHDDDVLPARRRDHAGDVRQDLAWRDVAQRTS